MFLSEVQKRIATGIVGIAIIFTLNYFGKLIYLSRTTAVMLLVELLMIYRKSPVEKWKKVIVILAGTIYAIIGMWEIEKSIEKGEIIGILGGVWLIDSVAFFSGRLIRGKLLAPRISPQKTWAGFICAIVAGGCYGPTLWGIIGREGIAEGIVVGCIFALVVQIGDLLVSVGKRATKIKDTSSILPGHGGFWDRCDSIIAGGILVNLINQKYSAIINIMNKIGL